METDQHIISFQKLVEGRVPEFDNSKKIKFVRHLDNRQVKVIGGKEYIEDLYTLYRNQDSREVFNTYQNEQKIANFEDVEYIVSFIGEENNTARFVGIYKNCGNVRIDDNMSKFNFQKVSGFKALEEKVIIDWGKNAISWHQWYDKNAKYVVRIDYGLSGCNVPFFLSYDDVRLNFEQLNTIFEKNDKEWRSKLEACNCIYLILDKKTGKQYVGATYRGQQSEGPGIWGRWKEYAETKGHGNDVSLKELFVKDNTYPEKYFQWSILEILPLNVSKMVATNRESLYKKKLGTLEFGYNNN